jgi:hypothetical protein
MTRLLSQLLGAKEPEFRLSLNELEKSNANPGEDIRLSAEIIKKTQDKIRELGLDPRDTTGEELYHALALRLTSDDHRLRIRLGITNIALPAEMFSLIKEFIDQTDLPRSCFAIKQSVIKRILTKSPPLKTMKLLGYRSTASMLKREPIAQIYAAAMITETGSWREALLKQYEDLKPTNFETRDMAIFNPSSPKWITFAENFTQFYHLNAVAFRELGAIVMLAGSTETPALTMTTTLQVLESMNDIRCSGAYFKLQQVRPDFGTIVVQILSESPTKLFRHSRSSLPWSIIQHYYGSSPATGYPEVFEPHVQPEDLALISAETVLAQKVPALEFWQNTAGLGYMDDGLPVSFNLADIASSVSGTTPFRQRLCHYMRSHIWRELLSRYLKPVDFERVLLEPKQMGQLQPVLAQIGDD